MEFDNQKTSELIQQNAEILDKIGSLEQLDEFANILRINLMGMDKNAVNPLALNCLCTNFLAKLICMTDQEAEIPQKCLNLIEFMSKQNLISETYKIFLENLLKKNLDVHYELTHLKSINSPDKNDITENFSMNLNVLLNLNSKAEKYINKNFGYSLLDLNGDFIWCDSNSESFFELQGKNISQTTNFFSLLIPYSVCDLNRRFNLKKEEQEAEIFGDDSKIGASKCFSYIIYSKQNMSKYIKHLRKKNIKNLEQIQVKTQTKNKGIFFKYLKGLSSKVTLIMMQFSKNEFIEIVKNPSMKLVVTPSLQLIAEDMKKSKIKKNEVFYKLGILCESRFSRKIPDFDFDEMKNDKKILEFESIVKSKINK